jgi:hypothetical protein
MAMFFSMPPDVEVNCHAFIVLGIDGGTDMTLDWTVDGTDDNTGFGAEI